MEAATKSIGDFWKLSRWARNTTPRAAHTPTLREGDREYVTAEEKADILRDVVFPPAPTADLSDLEGYDYPVAVKAPLITSGEVVHAIQRSASYKAPGPDGIPNAALKKAIEILSLLASLTHLFNECLRLGYSASPCTQTWANNLAVCDVRLVRHEAGRDTRNSRPLPGVQARKKLDAI